MEAVSCCNWRVYVYLVIFRLSFVDPIYIGIENDAAIGAPNSGRGAGFNYKAIILTIISISAIMLLYDRTVIKRNRHIRNRR